MDQKLGNEILNTHTSTDGEKNNIGKYHCLFSYKKLVIFNNIVQPRNQLPQ